MTSLSPRDDYTERPVRLLSPGEAQRLTQRIKLTASTIRDSLFKLRNLVEEAKNSNAWQVLGYPSWTAYLADTLADEPMRLGRDERQELVGYLSGEGLSTRAIAPIVGVSQKTIVKDTQSVEVIPEVSPAVPEPAVILHVRAETGEVIDDPKPVSTPVPRVVTGLDGKAYTATPKPRAETKPVPTGDEAERVNAEQGALAFTKALVNLWGLTFEGHRNRINREWWPLGSAAVAPSDVELVTPNTFRAVAAALNQLANEWEN